MTDTAILEASGLGKTFGGLVALQNYSIRVGAGDLIGLIGPNGAGKTTAFNLLTGVLKPSAGRISINNKAVTGQAAHVFARCGVARTFQNIRLFRDMSVLENVMTGLHVRHASSLFATVLGLPGFWRAERTIARRATELVEMLGLEFPEARAGDLAYGQQRRVEIARAVASEPEILLLDEPVAGMNEKESAELSALIARINSELGIAVVVVEHDIRFVMDLCDRIQVLNRGETLTEGSVETVRNDPAVIEAYLGTRRNRANA